MSRLDQLEDNLLVVTQAGKPTLLVRQQGSEKGYEGPGGVTAQFKKEHWIVESPANVTSIYNRGGQETSRRDANRNNITFTYDQAGRVSKIQAVKDHSLRLKYDNNGLLSSIESPSGEKSAYRYDSAGRLVEAVDAAGWKTTYLYTEKGKLSEVNYPSGETVRFKYDRSGRASKRVASSGGGHSYSHSSRATRITRQDGFWRETEYDEKGRPAKYRDSLKREQAWSWNSKGQLVERRFLDGSLITYAYDKQGRVIRQQTGRGDTLQTSYDGASSRPAKIVSNGAETRFTYDSIGNLVSVISPAGRKSTYEYDHLGRRISMTDGEGRKTRFEYDVLGNLTKQTNPDGGVISWKYDNSGRHLEEHDQAGRITTYAYHPNGLLASVTDSGGQRISYQYDSHGRLIEQTMDRDTIRYTYDKKGRRARVDYPDNTYEELSYDALGNPIRLTDALGRVTQQEFDPLGRLVKTTAPSGVASGNNFSRSGKLKSVSLGEINVQISTDAGGKVVRVTDSAGATVRLVKDRHGRVTQRFLPGGGQEQRQHDLDGLLEAVTLPMGDAWRFKHNGAGQLQEVIFPDDGKQTLAYDKAGRLVSLIYPSGNRVSFGFDPVNRLVQTTNGRGQRIEYEYDQRGQLTRKRTPGNEWHYQYDGRGNVLEASNGQLTVRHSYDRFGRLTKTEYPEWGKFIQYKRDKFGRVVERTDPEGNKSWYTYDKLGRISKIEGAGGHAFTFSYDQAGRLIEQKAANETTTQYGYDSTGRVVSIVHRDASGDVLAACTYCYDVDGNRVQVTDEQDRKTAYRYDLERRLVSETGPGGQKRYVYGLGGNRSCMTDRSENIAYGYDKAGILVQAGEVSFAYDADGNLALRKDKDVTTRYTYNSENNLVKVELPGGKTIAYGYGPFGHRIWREEDGSRTYHLLDGDDLLQELSADLKPLSTYLHAGLDRPLMVSSGDGKARFFHQDDLGTVLAITDTKGRVSTRYAYDAFGNIAQQEGEGGGQRLCFTGRPLDSATGLYDLRARFYDPETGRFISPDPVFGRIDDPATLPPYGYARDNPLTYVDPFGTTHNIGTININNALYFGRAPVSVEGMSTAEVWYTDMANQIFDQGIRQPPPPGVSPESIPASGLQGSGSVPGGQTLSGGQALGGGQTVMAPQQTGGGTVMAPGGATGLAPPQPGPGQPSGSGWWQAADQRIQAIERSGWSEWRRWQQTGPSAQSVGHTAGLGNLAMALADIAAEPIAAWAYGEDATAELDEAAQNLTGLAIGIAAVGLGTSAAGGLLVAAAPAAAPVVIVGGAVVSAVGLAYGAGNRLGTAYQEYQAAVNAQQEMLNNIQGGKNHEIFRGNQVKIVDSIEDKISKIETLIGGDLNELGELEIEVANRRHHATAQEARAENLKDDVKKLKDDKLTALDKLLDNITYGKDKKKGLNKTQAENDLRSIEALVRQACDHIDDDDGGQKTREFKSEAESKARKLKADISPNTEFYAALEMAKSIAESAQDHLLDAEELEQDIGSDLRGINERITLMKGPVENWQQAKRLHDTVRSSLNNLKVFGSLAEDLAALRPRFDRIALPNVEEGARLLSSANESKKTVERFLKELNAEKLKRDAGELKKKGNSVAEALENEQDMIMAWIQKADKALADARACVNEASKAFANLLIVPGSVDLSIGESKTFSALGLYPDGTTEPVKAEWPGGSSFTATQPGNFTISAKYRGLSGNATIIVRSDASTREPESGGSETSSSDEEIGDRFGGGAVTGLGDPRAGQEGDRFTGVSGATYELINGEWVEVSPPPSRQPAVSGTDIGDRFAQREDLRSDEVASTRDADEERSYATSGDRQGGSWGGFGQRMEALDQLQQWEQSGDGDRRRPDTPGGGDERQPGTTPFRCRANNDCWRKYNSNQYYCNKKNGKCIKCPPGSHGRKDGTAACCRDASSTSASAGTAASGGTKREETLNYLIKVRRSYKYVQGPTCVGTTYRYITCKPSALPGKLKKMEADERRAADNPNIESVVSVSVKKHSEWKHPNEAPKGLPRDHNKWVCP